MSRLRSSSRCSRNDILAAESSNGSTSRSSSPGVALGKGTSAMRGALCAAVLARHVAERVVGLARRGAHRGGPGAGGGGHRGGVGGDARRFLPLGAAPLLHPDFLVQGALQLVRGPLEFGEAFPERFTQFRELARPENDQGNREDDDEFGDSYGAKHDGKLYPRKVCYDSNMRTPRIFLTAGLVVFLSALAGGFL